jgi:hypothetical protein
LPSINLIKASDGTGNASTATVQTVRNSGVTTIIVDTVNNIPATFMGSMGTPHTFVDPVTSEEITVISEATAVDFTGHVSGANLEIDSIAPGGTDLGSAVGDIVVIRPTTDWANNLADTLAASHDNDGTLKAGAVDNSAVLAAGIINNSKLATDAGGIGGAMLAYTAPLTGFSGTPTQTAKFSIHGKFCKVYVDISGTSNAATFSFGIPVLSVNTIATTARVVDNTTGFYFGLVQISGYTADVFTSASGGGFTSSGTKRIINFEFEYEYETT